MAWLAGALLAGTALAVAAPRTPAWADVATAPYAIEAPANTVADVAAQPGAVVPAALTSFEVSFKLTAPLSGSSPGAWVSVVPSSALASAPVQVTLTDASTTTCTESGTGGGAASVTALTVDLGSDCSLAEGDVAEVRFTAEAPTLAHGFAFAVTTSSNPSPGVSNPVVAAASPPAFSSSSQRLGASGTYFIEGASWSGLTLSQSFSVVQLSAVASVGSDLAFSGDASAYTATLSIGGSIRPDEVLSATLGPSPGASSVTLVLAAPVGAGEALSIAAKGTNPATTSSVEVSVLPEMGSFNAYAPVGPAEATNSVLFGTSVSSLSVAVSPPVANAEATYTVSFQATTAFAGGPGATVCLGELAGPTNFATETAELVADTTAGWHFVAAGTSYPGGNPPANPGCDAFDNGAVIPVPLGYDVRAGDTLTLVLVNVTNPPAGTVSDFSVSTSADTVAARAAPYTVSAGGSPGVIVAVSPATTGSLATYAVSGLVASAPMTAGSTAITLEGPAGTVFPNDPAAYDLLDLSAPSASGTVQALASGGGTSTVAIVVPANVSAGDHLVLAIEDAQNPASAGGDYALTLLGPLKGNPSLAPFPRANLTYPNGAIVDFGGTYFVFAGGHAFGVASEQALYALEKVDRAEPQTAAAGAVPPEGALRPGALVFTRPINGQPTIYVAGTDGDLHGFATPSQLLADGYDPALVVTVPSLAGTPVGAPVGALGSEASALATSADGALVSSPNGWYVFAGGRAFGVPASSLGELRRLDRAAPVFGTVAPSQLAAGIAEGALVSARGVVYVSYGGELWPFKSPAQLAADGYGGTAAVPVPDRGGLSVVSAYSGS